MNQTAYNKENTEDLAGGATFAEQNKRKSLTLFAKANWLLFEIVMTKTNFY